MVNKNLYLIGTVHVDLEGQRRLEGLLNRISPDIIALEFNEDRENLTELKWSPEEEEREMEKMVAKLDLALTPNQRKTILECGRIMNSVMGYELRTCKEYIQKNPKTRLEYIDTSVFKNGKQKFMEGYTSAVMGFCEQIAQIPELKKLFLEMLEDKDKYLRKSQEGYNSMYQNSEMMEELAELLRDPETFEDYKEQLPADAVQALEEILNPKRDEFMANRINQLYNSGTHKLVAVAGLLHIPGLKSRTLDLDPTSITLADYDRN